MRIDSSGHVSIGQDVGGSAFNGASVLQLSPYTSGQPVYIGLKSDTSNNCGILMGDSDDSYVGGIIYNNPNNYLVINTNNAERMRIDSSGRVGIGNTNPLYELDIAGTSPRIRVQETTSNTGNTMVEVENSDGRGAMLGIGGSGRTDILTNRGYINAQSETDGLAIGTEGTDPILFYTQGVATSNERMRITSGGELRVGHNSGTYTHPNTFAQFGNTVVANEYGASISSSGNSLSGYFGSNAHWANAAFSKPNSSRSAGYLQIVNTATSNAGSEFIFRTVLSGDTTHYTRMIIESDGSLKVPSVHSQTTGVGANVVVLSDGELLRSTSSLKYKTDVRDYDKGLNEVMQLQPKYYKGKNDESETQFAGLIAENVHDLGLTEFVQYADDGSPDALSYSHMIALLTKSIQELKAEVDLLKKECKCK